MTKFNKWLKIETLRAFTCFLWGYTLILIFAKKMSGSITEHFGYGLLLSMFLYVIWLVPVCFEKIFIVRDHKCKLNLMPDLPNNNPMEAEASKPRLVKNGNYVAHDPSGIVPEGHLPMDLAINMSKSKGKFNVTIFDFIPKRGHSQDRSTILKCLQFITFELLICIIYGSVTELAYQQYIPLEVKARLWAQVKHMSHNPFWYTRCLGNINAYLCLRLGMLWIHGIRIGLVYIGSKLSKWDMFLDKKF